MTIDLDHPSTLVSTKPTRIMKSEKRVECPKEGPVYAATRGGNVEDLRDMARMGKRFVQTTLTHQHTQESKNMNEKMKNKKWFFFVVLSTRLTDVRCENSQELQRNFKLVTMFGFSAILMCSWESLLSSLSIVLTNGGTAGLIWTWAIVWLGFTAVYLSMAEVRL